MSLRSFSRVAAAAIAATLTFVGGAREAKSQTTQGGSAGTAQAAAEALFVEGKRLFSAGDFPRACQKLAESERLDPAPGTLLNLADCYEKNGQLASAWVSFREATTASERIGRTAWAEQARARARLLETRLPTLTIDVDPARAPTGLTISRNGVPVAQSTWGSAVPVDPAPARIEAHAPGKKPWTATVTVDARHLHVVVDVPPLEDSPSPPPVVAPKPPEPSAPSLVGPLVLAAAGGAGVVVGTYFGIRTIDLKNKRDAECASGCTPLAAQYHSDAATSGTVSTIAFVSAGVALAGALTWWWIDRAHAPLATIGTRFALPLPDGITEALADSFDSGRRDERPHSSGRLMKRFLGLGLLGAIGLAGGACTSLVDLGTTPAVNADAGAGETKGTDEVGPGSTEPGPRKPDGGSAAAPDAATTLDSDGGTASGTGPRLLVPGSAIYFIEGITTDGWVLYKDPTELATYAVSTAGGPPTLVVKPAAGKKAFGRTEGATALVYVGSEDLTVWTHATGAHSVTGIGFPWANVSADGRHVVYQATDPSTDPTKAQTFRLIEADLDLTNPLTLASSTRTGIGGDVGIAPEGYVFTTITPAGSGYTYSTDCISNAGVKTHLFDTRIARVVAGGRVLAYDAQLESISVRTTSGGPIVKIAPPAGSGGLDPFKAPAELSPDGTRALFADGNGHIWTASTSDGVPSQLANMPAPDQSWFSMSPDGTRFTYLDAQSQLVLASTTRGNPITLHSIANGKITYLKFTSDSRHVVFLDGTVLQIAPVETGIPVRVSDNVACEPTAQTDCVLAAHDSTLVYEDSGDLWSVDTMNIAHPKKLARSVVQFVLDKKLTTIAYRLKDSSPTADASGLYSVAVP